ncbi:hypothetical protein FSP39_022721, partial [Pinctada imbricata]
VILGLKEGQRCEEKPDKYQGYLMKRRRWPMKGWHKRYFVIEKGVLTYAKSPSDIQKGKLHGVIDLGLSVLAFKKQRQRIDIDAEDIVYHIKAKETPVFEEWLKRLKHHRLYRQHEIAYGTKDLPRLAEISSPQEDLSNPFPAAMRLPEAINLQEKVTRESMVKDSGEVIRKHSFRNQNSQGKVATWLLNTAGFEHCSKELSDTQKLLCDLQDDLNLMTSQSLTSDSVLEAKESESQDKRKIKGFKASRRKERKSDSYNSDGQNSIFHSTPSAEFIRTSNSNPNLKQYEIEMGGRPSLSESVNDLKLKQNFVEKAEKVHQNLKSLLRLISTERERLKNALAFDVGLTTMGSSEREASLKQSLAEACRQNAELKIKLARIHSDSAPVYDQEPTTPLIYNEQNINDKLTKSVSLSLSAETASMSEYYDAEEDNRDSGSEYSSEPSDEEDMSSEISEENETDYNAAQSVSEDQLSETFETGRRDKLPVPKPGNSDVSLWNILYKNIGKDLTKISMPVTLNEPLGMLQRLCEEMEYSELIDKATELEDPYDRMLYIAAFAVSGYASSGYRAGHKPFNPLLGESYECVREDRGWRFVAEQVSHHPPVSACHVESKNFTLFQDTQIKTKFWGKSMEFQPLGEVHVVIPRYGDHYTWNKVTTCVHNLLGGQRWVDQYGEMMIKNGLISCKLTFKKASQWSSRRHEVYGHITNSDGKHIHHIYGKWNEALFCGHAPSAKCIWRPGAMPDDYELYYGFSRFAMELNEIVKEECRLYPLTDSRYRPDQRLLEEGKIKEAETEKQRLEQLQRERRKQREAEKTEYSPLWFRKVPHLDKQNYEYGGQYWERRKDPGFTKLSFPKLW